MLHKPRKLVEVAKNCDPFQKGPRLVNLHSEKSFKIPLVKFSKAIFTILAFLSFFANTAFLPSILVLAPTSQSIYAAESDAERKALEAQLSDLESQINQYQNTISGYRKQGSSLKSEIDILNAKIAKLNLQIKAISLTISQLDQNITLTKTEISKTENDIDGVKAVIGRLLQDMYENESENTIEIFLEHPKLSDFFSNLNNIVLVKDNLRGELKKITGLRDDLVDKKDVLALQKSDAEAIKIYQNSQRQIIQKTKSEKNDLLSVTKGQESKYQELLTQTQKTAADIRNRIFRLLGGGELPFGEAVKIAKVAEKAIGIRAALILAVLTQESSVNSVIGANLGKCYYNTPRNNSSGTVMSDGQKQNFLSIMASLKLNPDTTPVSCPISSDGAYGGAIGPAQFMPNTWMLYVGKIASITGGSPVSPFNNLDAFTATALYLNDGMTGCRNSWSGVFQQENCAAAKYYAGGKYRSYMGVGRYGYRVADRAQNFEQDIEVLNNN